MDKLNPLLLSSGFILVIFLYFTPTMIAGGRTHHKIGKIFTVNILLGWTVIGWVVALVWSLSPVQSLAPRRDSAEDTDAHDR